MYILHSFWNQIPQHLTEITVNVLSKIWIEFYILGKDSHSRGKENHIWHCIRKYSTVDKSTSRKNSSKSQQQVANLIIVETEVFKGGSLKNLPKLEAELLLTFSTESATWRKYSPLCITKENEISSR